MSDFLLSVAKGIYPLYLIFLALGIYSRISRREWTGFDSMLLGAFLFFEILAAVQVSLFYGVLSTSKRYLWIGIILYLPLAAQGVLWLIRSAAKKRWYALPAWALLATICGIGLYNTYSPIFHDWHSVKRARMRTIVFTVSDYIRADWHNRPYKPVMKFKYDCYQSGKRPLVRSPYTHIGWLCGGQQYYGFLAVMKTPADYIVSPTPVNDKRYILIRRMRGVYIYRHYRLHP